MLYLMTNEISRLAAALVETERRLIANRPASVVVRGSGDEALAIALVAAKLEIPIEVADGGEAPSSDTTQATNRRLIELLAR